MNKKALAKLIEDDPWMMKALKIAASLNLPDWWLGAGFIRSKVWDYLHGYKKRTPLPDLDFIYFDTKDFSKKEASKFSTKADEHYQKILNKKMPEAAWSVTNQARMHLFHRHKPYRNSSEALSFWVETATCIGAKLSAKGKVVLTAPRGMRDLVNLIVRPIPEHQNNRSLLKKRIKEKKWLTKWPKLKVV